MFQRIHEKLGTAGFVIAIVALIAALSGGAYAASGGLTGKQKKEVEKFAKNLAGKPGANGTNGTNGTSGGKGDTGANGPQGAQGAQGPQGAQGKQGIQGLPGEDGKTGFTEFLPKGEEEKGIWTAFATSFEEKEIFPTALGSISFSIPLNPAAVPTSSAFVFTSEATENEQFGKNETTGEPCVVGEAECEPTGCEGTLQEPTASPGVLCVYTDTAPIIKRASGTLVAQQVTGEGPNQFSETGALLNGIFLKPEAGKQAIYDAHGSWAVQAP